MPYTISETTLEAKPVLVVRRTVEPTQIAETIGEAYGRIHAFLQQRGFQMAGPPFTRYVDMQPPHFTLEPGMPIASSDGVQGEGEGEGEGQVTLDSLPSGPAAVTLHVGPYDKLGEAYSALQEWITSHGLRPAGAPWEEYLNDPQVVKDPAAFETAIYWPVAR